MTDLKNSAYWKIYAEAWEFFKEALPVKSDSSYWDSRLAEGEKIAEKYSGTPQEAFAKDQVFAVINELDRIKTAGTFASFVKQTQGEN